VWGDKALYRLQSLFERDLLLSENLNAIVLTNRMPRMFLVLLIVIPIKMLWCHHYFTLPKLQKFPLQFVSSVSYGEGSQRHSIDST
jgi:hypothetical protein